jgi:hypothetical protein
MILLQVDAVALNEPEKGKIIGLTEGHDLIAPDVLPFEIGNALSEEVVIKRRGGETFSIIFRKSKKSPFDVPGIQTKATTKDILLAIRESRERFADQNV